MKINKRRLLFSSTILILIIIFLVNIIIKNTGNKETILVQLSPQSSRQMMGYILKTYNGKLIIIDGGTVDDTQNLIHKINENGGKVDYWFITHAHDDHAGAFNEIVNKTNIEIKNIYVSLNDYSWYEEYEPTRIDFTKKLINTLNSEKIKNIVKETQINEKFNIENIKVEILGIKNPEITENPGNEQSMIIRFDTGKATLLILGDIGKEGSKKLISQQKDKLKSDIVQVSHHGQNGATKELYQIIKPKICLWPTTKWLWDNDSGEGERNRTMENFRYKKMDGRTKCTGKLHS